MTQRRRKRAGTSEASGTVSIDAMLSRIATPLPQKTIVKVPKRTPGPPPNPVGRFTSRFFVKDVSDIVADMKAANKPRRLEPDNKELSEFETRAKKTLPKLTQPNIKRVRQFFIEELAPLTMAVGAAVFQAKAVLKATTGEDPDPSAFANFERMAKSAVNLRMAQFLQDYLSLPAEAVSLLLESNSPARPPVRPTAPDMSQLTDALSSLERAMAKSSRRDRNGPVKG